MTDVFISYSVKDEELAQFVQSHLAAGCPVGGQYQRKQSQGAACGWSSIREAIVVAKSRVRSNHSFKKARLWRSA
jgi:hypothetical protein